MASSSSEDDLKSLKSTADSSLSSQPQPQSQSQSQSKQKPAPPHQPEQLSGYPFPPVPYQGYHPQPYQGYPGNNYQYAAQPPPQPPPGYYNTNPHSFVVIGPPQRSQAYKLARVFLVIMIVLFLGMSVMSFLTWLIYGSDIPVFHAEALEMTIFDMNKMALNTTWSANVSVKNPSNKYEVSYDYVEATLVYDDHLLDTNYVNPFLLKKKEKKSFSSGFQTPNANQKSIVGATWEKDIEEERRERGAISFDMRIVVNVVFRSNDHDRTLRRTLKVLCGDLKVVFPSPVDTLGKFNDGYKECLIVST